MSRTLPIPLPPTRPVSGADAALRATLTELVVHLPCGGVRGPIGRIYARCDCAVNDGVWQSCSCEDEPVRWLRCDVSREVDLCRLCARGIAGGPSRWAWLGCPDCRAVNEEAGRLLGRRPVPLGRHSIMNGAAVRPLAGEAELRAQQEGLLDVFQGWDDLYAWFEAEYRRLAATQGWADVEQVLLRTWQQRLPPSRATSRDALQRFTGLELWPR